MLRNLGTVFNHGRLAGTGYVSILPVDQGIEHSAAASFSKNPAYFDPLNLLELALAGECSAVATTLGTLGLASRKYVHRIPFIVKLNHNAFLHVPTDQIMFGSVRQAFDLGAVGVGATIYFGSDDMDRELQQVSEAFAEAHELGMFTVLWCYLRNPAFTKDGVNYEIVGRPDGPGQPHGRHDRGRHHQAEAADEQRRLHGHRLRQAPTRSSTTSSPPTTRSTSPAGRSSTATPAASASSTRAASPRATATWPRRSAPPSSTSGPAAWA